MFEARPPIDLTNKRLRRLAKALGPSYVRVSGTWANSVYFQDDQDAPTSPAPKGFRGVLTRAQWARVVDFSHAVDAKLVTSFAISAGVRDAAGTWAPDQAQRLVNYTKSVGGEIAAAELFNEPTMPAAGGAPPGYDASTFAHDEVAFREFVKSSVPGMRIASPGSVGEGGMLVIPPSTPSLKSEDLLGTSPQPKFDVFSYHFMARFQSDVRRWDPTWEQRRATRSRKNGSHAQIKCSTSINRCTIATLPTRRFG